MGIVSRLVMRVAQSVTARATARAGTRAAASAVRAAARPAWYSQTPLGAIGSRAGAASRVGRAARAVSSQPPLFRFPARIPLIGSRGPTIFSRNLRVPTGRQVPVTYTQLRQPVTLPGGARVTRLRQPVKQMVPEMRAATGRDRAAMALRSPARFINAQLSPANLGMEALATLGFAGAVPALQTIRENVREREQNRTAQNPYAPPRPGAQAPGVSTYDPTKPIRPGNSPYTPGAVTPSTGVGNRPRGNQPTTITPGSLPPPGRGLNPTPPRVFTPPPAPAPSAPAPNPAAANREDFERELGRLQSTYAGMVDQIRGAYNLAPTEEEKQLLLDDLADLEAENESAKLALASLFAEKDKTISAIEAKSRQMTTERAQGIGQLYSEAGQSLADLDAARRAAVAASTPGYGAAIGRDSNIDAELLATLAPMAQSYAQEIGDIGSQGLQYVLGLTQGVGAARQGELQSAYAGRRAGIRGDWSERVADRIANERLQMANNLSSLAERQLSVTGSMAKGSSDEDVAPTAMDAYDNALLLAQNDPYMTDEEFYGIMESFGLTVTPEIYAAFAGKRWLEQQLLSDEGGNLPPVPGLPPAGRDS